MKLLYILYTYNRPKVLNECWRTLFENNNLRPDKIIVLDDGSYPKIKEQLLDAQRNKGFDFDFYSAYPNLGYGKIAERGIKLAEIENPDYVFFIESDYAFSKNGLDIVMDLFENNEFGKEAIYCAGYSHPDYFSKEKTDVIFPRLMEENGVKDNLNRSILYKPFKQQTNFGEIEMQFVSNTCGTIYFNWKKFQQMSKNYPKEYEAWFNKTTEKAVLNDGAFSSLACYIWNLWAIDNNIDRNKFSAAFDIIPTVANHFSGGETSINSKIVPEGSSIVHSPSWKGPQKI